MSKSDIKTTERFVSAVQEEDPAKAKDILEKVLKDKCAKKIAAVLREQR